MLTEQTANFVLAWNEKISLYTDTAVSSVTLDTERGETTITLNSGSTIKSLSNKNFLEQWDRFQIAWQKNPHAKIIDVRFPGRVIWE